MLGDCCAEIFGAATIGALFRHRRPCLFQEKQCGFDPDALSDPPVEQDAGQILHTRETPDPSPRKLSPIRRNSRLIQGLSHETHRNDSILDLLGVA